MSEHEHKQESTVLRLLEHLPRATAPVDFEETTLLRAMLSSLPVRRHRKDLRSRFFRLVKGARNVTASGYDGGAPLERGWPSVLVLPLLQLLRITFSCGQD